MPDDPILARVRARSAALIARVQSHGAELSAILPVSVADVQHALAAVPRDATVTEWAADIARGLNRLDDPAACAGLVFEWFYDGAYRTGNEALATAYAECDPGPFGDTDLVKLGPELGIERDTKKNGLAHDAGGIGIDAVMAPWYDQLEQRFDDFDRGPLVGTELLGPFNEAEEAFTDLFQLKMVSLLHAAYTGLDGEKPRYCLLTRHERWPMLAADAS